MRSTQYLMQYVYKHKSYYMEPTYKLCLKSNILVPYIFNFQCENCLFLFKNCFHVRLSIRKVNSLRFGAELILFLHLLLRNYSGNRFRTSMR
jgi:hypothetical protein